VVVESGEIEVFDPLEFDPALCEIDISAELAFLVMDLMSLGANDLAEVVIDKYRAAGCDCGGSSLLFFYAAYRAWVRAKVAVVTAGELPSGIGWAAPIAEARRLAALAPARLARAPPARARHLRRVGDRQDRPGGGGLCAVRLRRLSSELARKELAGVAPHERAGAEQHAEAASLRAYRELGACAAAHADSGAVVDATFRRRSHRMAFADAFGGRALFIQSMAPAAVVAERATRRERDSERVSDATAAIAAKQLEEFESLDEVPAQRHVLLRTDRPLEELVDELETVVDAAGMSSG